MAIQTHEEIEKICLNRISGLIDSEPDINLKSQIEEAGRAICKCMPEQSTKRDVIHRVMVASARALPVFARAPPARKRLKSE